jgi:hypothetical protein
MAWEQRRQRLLVAGLIAGNLFGTLGSDPGDGSISVELPATQGMPGKGVIATVEASWEPYVSVEHGGQRFDFINGYDVETEEWSGTKQLFVPADASRADAVIGGECTGGCCSSCFDDSVFVRVTSTEVVDVWTLQSPVERMVGNELDPGSRSYSIRVRTSGTPLITFRVDRSEPEGVSISLSTTRLHPDGATFDVILAHPEAQNRDAAPASVDWSVQALASAPCPEPGPCMPGPDDTVDILILPGNYF